jgi:kynureninase
VADPLSLAEADALDAADPLRGFRDRFTLPEGVVYLDGNSLGALPRATPARIAEVVAEEWGDGLVRSWNDAGWITLSQRVGAQIAPLIGAATHEVTVADSTSVNLFKLIIAAAELAPGRGTIVTEAGNFPTDLHVARRAAALTGRKLVAVAAEELETAIDADTALAVLSHVHYRSAYRQDIAALTMLARDRGARIVWDLSHSAGAVPIDLHAAGVELAVGCGYKYLNGGPGAPSFLYVAEALHDRIVSPIAGWLGHADPFAFDDEYRPASGIARFHAGTPSILTLSALEVGVGIAAEADMASVWAKSQALFDRFRAGVAARCPAFELASPIAPGQRGSHISFRHPHAYEIVQAAIAEGLIGDFRAPDIARFGLTPLYIGHCDVVRAVTILADILDRETWRDPRFTECGVVT